MGLCRYSYLMPDITGQKSILIKTKPYLVLFCFVLLLNVNHVAFCHKDAVLTPVTGLNEFIIQERVLLIPDQDFYLAGENINFYALTIDAALQIPVDLSAILYVELLDQDNSVVNSTKILLKNGEAINSLSLPRQLKTGFYHIRAYTNYMKNFGPGTFFMKRMKIVNPFYAIDYGNSNNVFTEKFNLKVVVEGGKMIYGIKNKLAFFSPGSFKRLFVRLYKNDSILAETNAEKGWGTFTLTPETDGDYRIEAISHSLEKTTVNLKHIDRKGVACKLDSVVNNKVFINVVAKAFDKFPLTVYIDNNGIVYEYSEKLYGNANKRCLQVPYGLNKIFVTDNTNNEVSYRLAYVKPESQMDIAADISKQKAQPGDSVDINFSSNSPDSVNYLLAVKIGDINTAVSFPGLVESAIFAASVASLTNEKSAEELIMQHEVNLNDYLLKFTKGEIRDIQPKNIQYLPETTHDIVTGRIIKKSGGNPAAHKIVYQAFVDSICWVNHSKTDNQGRFVFSLPFDYQGNELVITVKDSTTDYSIEMEDEFYPYFLKLEKEKYYPDSSLKDIIESRMLILQVNDAYSGQIRKRGPDRPSLRFYGYPDKEYQFRDYQDLVNFEEFVFEIVKEAGIDRVRKNGIKVLYETTYNVIGDNPLFLLDGIPLSNSNQLAGIPTKELESVRIVTDRFFFGSDVYDGIMDITSNSKSFNLIDMEKNSARTVFVPVKISKGERQLSDTRTPDYQSVIYFNKIKTAHGTGKVKLKVPHNRGNYSFGIFGYNKTGEWGYKNIYNALSIEFINK